MDEKDWDRFAVLIEKIVNSGGGLTWMEKRNRIIKELKERDALDDFNELYSWFEDVNLDEA